MVRATQPKTPRRRKTAEERGWRILSPEESRALFDEHARRYMNMSGDEFIAAWNRGDFNFDPDYSEAVGHLWMMMPFGLAR